MPKYVVPIVYRGLNTYIIEAPSPEEAREKALAEYQDGEPGVLFASDWEEVDRVGDIKEIKPE
jgi:hypothetical protein